MNKEEYKLFISSPGSLTCDFKIFSRDISSWIYLTTKDRELRFVILNFVDGYTGQNILLEYVDFGGKGYTLDLINNRMIKVGKHLPINYEGELYVYVTLFE